MFCYVLSFPDDQSLFPSYQKAVVDSESAMHGGGSGHGGLARDDSMERMGDELSDFERRVAERQSSREEEGGGGGKY